MRVLDRWLRLTSARRRLLTQTLVAVPVATATVRALGANRARYLMPRLPWRVRSDDRLEDVGWAVESVGRRVPGAKCLAKAVAAEAILISGARVPELHLGARRNAYGEIEAHAWVEVHGVVVVGAEERDSFALLEPRGRTIRPLGRR